MCPIIFALSLLGVSSCVLTLGLTPLLRYCAIRLGLVDRPDAERKFHGEPIPRIGGVAVATSLALSFLLAWVVAPQVTTLLSPFWCLLPGACLVFILGLYDDIHGLKARHKLAVQFVAAVVTVLLGVRITGFPGHADSSWWTYPATILWLLICTNSINLIDGLDGLATGISIFGAATIIGAAVLQGNFLFAAIGIPLLGSLAGFLRFNFNPATIFLGDCGSLLIGFLLGCYSIMWGQYAPTGVSEALPLIALAVPLGDVGLTVTRRFLRGHPLFCPDRGHIHHRLLARGHSVRSTAIVLYATAAFFSGVALCIYESNWLLPYLGLAFISAFAMVRYLNYPEFSIAGQALTVQAFQRLISKRMRLHVVKEQLSVASTPEDCWNVLRSTYREFGFNEIVLQLDGENRIDRSEAEQSLWRVEIPISAGILVAFRYTSSPRLHEEVVGGFLLVVRDALTRAIWVAGRPSVPTGIVPIASPTTAPGV